jgi:hypothetical protein
MDSIQNDSIMTSFMGVALSKDGPNDPRITRALNLSGSLLDILKFIEVTEFDLNKVMFDYFSTNGPLAHSYDMLAGGQHGVASYGRKHASAPGGACI